MQPYNIENPFVRKDKGVFTFKKINVFSFN